jgi:N-acetylglucosaminyl-diphospho-decaprenol L-rhamnosyltransferase
MDVPSRGRSVVSGRNPTVVPPHLDLLDAVTALSARPTDVAVAVSCVVVNFRQTEHTKRLLRQLDRCEAIRTGGAEIVLVDNDTDMKPLHNWASRRPGVALHSFGRNRGFARAVNAGFRHSKGEWLLLLNPDISVSDEFLDKAIATAQKRLEADPDVGIIGFSLRHADGTPQASTGPFPTLRNVMMGLVKPRSRRRCRHTPQETVEVPWATGCCLLVRRLCWEELGGCDEEFFLYYEDVDLCRRARAAGWTVWHESEPQVMHYHPLHSRAVAPPLRLITRHALLTYAGKHWPRWQFRLLARLVGWEGRLRALFGRTGREHFRRLTQIAGYLSDGHAVRARHLLAQSARALSEAAE